MYGPICQACQIHSVYCSSRFRFLVCSYHQPRQNCLCVASTSTQQLFSYTCVSKSASDVTEARRLDQEAVLFVILISYCLWSLFQKFASEIAYDWNRLLPCGEGNFPGVSPSWHARYQLAVWLLSSTTPIGVTPSYRPHHASLTA